MTIVNLELGWVGWLLMQNLVCQDHFTRGEIPTEKAFCPSLEKVAGNQCIDHLSVLYKYKLGKQVRFQIHRYSYRYIDINLYSE